MKRSLHTSLLFAVLMFTLIGLTDEIGATFSPPVEMSLVDADRIFLGEETSKL